MSAPESVDQTCSIPAATLEPGKARTGLLDAGRPPRSGQGSEISIFTSLGIQRSLQFKDRGRTAPWLGGLPTHLTCLRQAGKSLHDFDGILQLLKALQLGLGRISRRQVAIASQPVLGHRRGMMKP